MNIWETYKQAIYEYESQEYITGQQESFEDRLQLESRRYRY